MTQVDARAPGLSLRGLESERPPAIPTAVTGFVGLAQRGPLHCPQPLASWGEYLQVFGGFVSYGSLAESVFAFFLNGGERCHVVRTADTRDRSGETLANQCPRVLALATAESTVSINDHNGKETMRLLALNEGSWGNAIRVDVRHESSRDIALTTLTQAADVATDRIVVDEVHDLRSGSAISIADATNRFQKHSYTVSNVDETTLEVTLVPPDGLPVVSFASGSTVYGRGFRLDVSYRDDIQEQRETFDELSMSPNSPRYFLTVINGSPDFENYIERQRRGHSILIRAEHVFDLGTGRSRFKPRSSEVLFKGGHDGFTQARADLHDASDLPSLTVVATGKLGRTGNLLRVRAEPFETRTALAVVASPAEPVNHVVVERVAGFVAGETLKITDPDDPAITDDRTIQSVNEENVVTLTVPLTTAYPLGSIVGLTEARYSLAVLEDGGEDPIERFDNVSNEAASGDRFVRTVVNGTSDLVCVDKPHSVPPPGPPPGPPSGEVRLHGGRDPGEIPHQFYTGYDAGGLYADLPGVESDRRAGLASLEHLEDVSLVAIPDLYWATSEKGAGADGATDGLVAGQNDLLFHCATMGDRFALLDPPPPNSSGDAPTETIASWPGKFSDVLFTKYGALYYPWLDALFLQRPRRVPPCGFMAGVFATSDREGGVGLAPANFRVKGVFDLARLVTRTEHEELNPRGVNCLRKFEDGQIRVMGARTLSADPNHRYVNVRRVLLSVIKTLTRTMAWTVFEPNDPILWNRIESRLSRFLTTMVSKGLTASPLVSESFYVKCDEETNREEVRDAGQVVAEIGLALVAPAEFIVLTVRKTPESLGILEEET